MLISYTQTHKERLIIIPIEHVGKGDREAGHMEWTESGMHTQVWLMWEQDFLLGLAHLLSLECGFGCEVWGHFTERAAFEVLT